MEHNPKKHPLRVMHTMCDEFEERAVDTDIILPDYCPEIAEILKCTLTPRISRTFQNGDRYMVEGSTQIRVFYLSNDRNELHCYETEEPFNVSSRVENAVHYDVSAKTDYVNCRAVNAGRMDIHGAFRVHLNATGTFDLSVVSPCNTKDICCKCTTLVSTIPVMQVDKSFSISESIPLGMDCDRFLYSDINVTECEHKVLTNKVIVKGKLIIRSVICKNDTVSEVNETIPFSQIVDTDGMCDDFKCCVKNNISEKDIRAVRNETGTTVLSVNIKLTTHIMCFADERSDVILDAYSVSCPLLCETTTVSAVHTLSGCDTQHTTVSLATSLPENTKELVDLWGDVCSDTTDKHTCYYTVCAFVRDTDGRISYIENVIEDTLAGEEENVVSAGVCRMKGMISDNQLHIRAETEICRQKEEFRTVSVVSELIEDTQNPFIKPKATVRIVYANAGDSVWNIAKAQHAVVDTILDENDLESDCITQPTVLMIPV